MIADDSIASATAAGSERTRFFPRQLVTPGDLTQDQRYFLNKLRRHNRLLHGWGVVRGANVRPGDGPYGVVVEAGYVLGPHGDEIVIPDDVEVDLRREGLDGYAVQPCGEGLDVWCSDVTVDRAGQTLYLAVRHVECQARPVRVMTDACGSDLTECEYSRIRDGYAIKVLEALPPAYEPAPPGPAAGPGLPPPSDEPWVVLASVTVGVDGTPPEIGGVVRWHPAAGTAGAAAPAAKTGLVAVVLERNPARSGQRVNASILLGGPAPANAVVHLKTSVAPIVGISGVSVPSGLDVPAGANAAPFIITTTVRPATFDVVVEAFYEGVTRTSTLRLIGQTG